MPSYTLHMNLEAHPYVYHRNIRIQHCVHAVVHLPYPGKKPRLKISAHSDRNNNYFYSNVYIKLECAAFKELCYLQAELVD